MVHSHLVAIGDLYVDILVDLAHAIPPVQFDGITSSSSSFGSWSREPGGSALQVARAARLAGFDVATCVGALGAVDGGPDVDARLLEAAADEWGVTLAVAFVPNQPTGEALLIYDTSGSRLMVSSPGANMHMTHRLLTTEMFDRVAAADVVHVAGYTMLVDSRWQAVRSLVGTQRSDGALVAVDLAPHNIDGLVEPRALFGSLHDVADCVMLEADLLTRLASALRGRSTSLDEAISWCLDSFRDLVVHLSPTRALVGRDGCLTTDRSFPYQAGPKSRGHSAGVQAELLATMIGQSCNPL